MEVRNTYAAALTSKGQITLPKPIRDRLGLKGKGDRVGFTVSQDGKTVHLTKVHLVSDERLTELKQSSRGKLFAPLQNLLRDLQRP